jgi:6-phosphofructokinase 1
VLEAALSSGRIGRILGSRSGVEGVLNDSFVDLTSLPAERRGRLRRTPSAALGTSRHRPTDDEIRRMLDRFRDHRVSMFVPIGGNDTADTAQRLVDAASARAQDLTVVLVPKTIDNDLPRTDHCPGYGSIARFVALSVRDATFDTRAMRAIYPVKIVEVMGRNAGWLTAAGSLGFDDHPRPVLCLPERPFADFDQLGELVRERISTDGYAVIVVPETMKWIGGAPVAGDTPDWVDAFGHRYFPGVGAALERLVRARLDLRARHDKPGTIARMALHAVSEVDLAEAEACGREAVRLALAGVSGVMVSITRIGDDPYQVAYGHVQLGDIASIERHLPDEMIASSGIDVTDRFASYALPLIGAPLPRYELLD